MHRQATHAAYPQTAPTPSRYPAKSSAFSASANPNEDWTKISDLAERRRIQNRIAQRNYRKKLKKRLEDLERRAASNSASPEQKPAELDRKASPKKEDKKAFQAAHTQPQELQHQHHQQQTPASFFPVPEDHLFSHTYGGSSRPLSRSPPPPFPYSTLPSETLSYSTASPDYAATCTQMGYAPALAPTCSDVSVMPPYAVAAPPAMSTAACTSAVPSIVYASKQEPSTQPPSLYHDDELSFSSAYPLFPGMDSFSTAGPGQWSAENLPHTPPLSDIYEHAASPPESVFNHPRTPASYPPSPPLTFA